MSTFKSLVSSVLFSLVFTGCLTEYFDPPVTESDSPDLVFALAWDQSKSADIREIPKMSSETLDTLFAISRRRGGELAFASISDRTPKILRVKLIAEQGVQESVVTARKYNEVEISRIRQPVQQTLRSRTAPHTRLYDCLEMLIFYLKEPHHAPDAQKILVIISDFEEDTRAKNQRHQLRLPPDVTAITIGAHPDSVVKVLDGASVYTYTTIEAVSDFLKTEHLK